ncbi:hypothetical protein JCM11641_004562 [Rhodosporidiobolus odoratus]
MSCLATPLRFLRLSPAELNLATAVKSGQSFRWILQSPVVATQPDHRLAASASTVPVAAEGVEEWAFPWQDRTVVMRQDDQGLYYRSLYPFAPPHSAFLADLASDTTLAFIRRYFQLDVPIVPLYEQWAAQDPKMKKKVESAGEALRGIRVLAQDEWETLVSFICSANNNISRITLMVNRLCAARGSPLPHPSHFTPACVHAEAFTVPKSVLPQPNDLSLFSFPPPSTLTDSTTETLLRQLGFGYRASFIPFSAAHLLSVSAASSQSPDQYLRSLRREAVLATGKGIADAREKLLEFKGVGRKVADCVLLFGLGWAETVPVDTHVFHIAIRDYGFPATRTTSLTPALHDRVAEHLSSRWGNYAGWCQQVLFFAELKPSSPTKKSETSASIKFFSKIELAEEETVEGEEQKRKLTFEEEVAALIADPGKKRSRRSVVQVKETRKIEVKEEAEESALSSPLSSPEPDTNKAKAKGGQRRAGRGRRVKVE